MTTDALLTTSCPSDAGSVLAGLEWGLRRALVRRGESYHVRTCRDAGVNSRLYGCSDDCLRVQVALAWAEIWRERHAAERPVQGALLAEEVAG